MKNYRLISIVAAISVLAASCSERATISGTVTGLSDSQVIVKKLSGSSVNVLDTVKTDASGNYSYKMKIEEGNPQFVYVFKDSSRIASLILSSGDKVQVVSDTVGNYSVEGSEESVKLQQVDKDFASFIRKLSATVASEDASAVSRAYVDYYRSRIKYIMDNPKSLTVIPVLYQKINEGFPVFSQATDAILYKNAYDSLMTVYPNSQYVAALGKEAKRKENLLNLDVQMRNAPVTSFPDIEMPSSDGKKIKLSEVDAKVVMLYFWLASSPDHKMFNNDVLIPLYKDYHSKGFEIYSVALDTDKGVWASAVKDQNLEWINVCDGLGAGSPAISIYNVANRLPVALMIIDGELKDIMIKGEKDLRKVLDANLK